MRQILRLWRTLNNEQDCLNSEIYNMDTVYIDQDVYMFFVNWKDNEWAGRRLKF